MSHLKSSLKSIPNLTRNFKVLSYNIWFEEHERLGRLESLMATIAESNPDVVCMQEVIPDIYEILKLKLVQYPHFFPENLDHRYGSVTMSKYPMENCIDKKFMGSRMGRSLIITTINVPTYSNTDTVPSSVVCNITPIVVGNTHFESEFQRKESNNEKLYQYAHVQSTLESLHDINKNVIFCSDTNLLPHEDSLFFSDDAWKDTWKEKGSVSEQFTYDYFTNENLRIKNVGKFRSRLDRILYRNDNLKVTKFSVIKGILGMTPPSDHHGVEATFAF